MAEQILMLALSPTMETGAIAKWHFHEGDAVASGAVLCEVETDKAVMDYEVTTEGVLLKILVPEGSEASVGEAIAIIGKQGEDIRDLVAEASSKPAKIIQNLRRKTQNVLRNLLGRVREKMKLPQSRKFQAKKFALPFSQKTGTRSGA
jgi:pyruvate/2-oxoglutarate dehydrogenase complex dihydrolipoamide acyltransferase (E2) component